MLDLSFLSQDQPTEQIQSYDHGFSEDQVSDILEKHKILMSRDLFAEPVTIEEMKQIVIPAIRINRTEDFILLKPKEKKVKVPKEPKEPKAPKPKKLTKKQITTRMNDLVFKKILGEELTEEENEFYEIHSAKSEL